MVSFVAINEGLQTLDISWNKIQPQGGAALCHALRVCVCACYACKVYVCVHVCALRVCVHAMHSGYVCVHMLVVLIIGQNLLLPLTCYSR